MNKLTLRNYSETNTKYRKLKNRFDKNVKSGSFYEFSKKKQRSLIHRLRGLYEKLLRLKKLLKLATAGATMALALTTGQVNAQNPIVKNPFKGKFNTELKGQKVFESDLFVQMTGLNNPFGGENPFDGQLFSNAEYANFVDIDNDGDFDVISSNFQEGTIYHDIKYYENTGSNALPNFVEKTGVENPFDGLIFDSKPFMSFIDIDSDADFDVFINNQIADEIYYYENIGTVGLPYFEEQTGTDNYLDGVNPMSADRLSFADIDNDGDLDVFIGEYNNYPYLYRNTGTASAPVFIPENASGLFDNTESFQESVVLVDLDNDDDLDAVINGDDYYENQGNNTIPAFVEQTGVDNPFDNVQKLGSDLITLTDLDGDSDLDLLFGDGEIIFYYENVGDVLNPIFEDRNGGVSVTYVAFPTFVDIDNDGDYDMFTGTYYGSDTKLSFFKNVGTSANAEFEQQFGVDNPMNSFLTSSDLITVESVDIDSDGDYDLFIGDFDYYVLDNKLVKYYKNIGSAGSPQFELQTGDNNPLNILTGYYFVFMAFADIDYDGDYDLLQSSLYGENFFYRNTGTPINPVFESEENPVPFDETGYINIPEFVDIDDDGDIDIFSGTYLDNGDWEIKYYLNEGTIYAPDFIEQFGKDHPLDLQGEFLIPSFVDIDSDNDQDCFLSSYYGQMLYFMNITNGSNDIENISENSLKLYPNPTKGIIAFETEVFGNEDVKIGITDLTGKEISNYRLVDYNKIDLSDLKGGMFFLKISNSSVSKVSKIIVQ